MAMLDSNLSSPSFSQMLFCLIPICQVSLTWVFKRSNTTPKLFRKSLLNAHLSRYPLAWKNQAPINLEHLLEVLLIKLTKNCLLTSHTNTRLSQYFSKIGTPFILCMVILIITNMKSKRDPNTERLKNSKPW